MTRRLTGKDVAKKAGVSPSAVSRAFTSTERLNSKTREHILKVAAEMGYRPNALARSLIKQQSDLIAIVSGHMDNLYDKFFFDHLSDRLQKANKWGLLIRSNPDVSLSQALAKALDYPLQAAIVRAGTIEQEAIDECKKMNVPLIFNGGGRIEGADSVSCDHVHGGELGTQQMIDRGCRRIAYVGGITEYAPVRDRREGFLKAMQAAGLTPHSISDGGFDFEFGLQMGEQLLTSSNPPDGVLCVTDSVALGIHNAATRLENCRIPDDIAIVGCDDIPLCAWPSFELTVTTNPVKEITSQILEVLDIRMQTPDADPIFRTVKPELIVRKSA